MRCRVPAGPHRRSAGDWHEQKDACAGLPHMIDATRDADADVPAEFKAVQWTRLPGGDGSEEFCARVKTLLGGSELEAGRPRPAHRDEGVAASSKRAPLRSWSVPATRNCWPGPRR